MSARLTVVLDDESLYRDLKVRAAETGVPVKSVIEEALRSHLRKAARPRLTLEMWQEWQEEAHRMDEELPPDTPTDLSDIKHHLYGWPKQSERHAAEEKAEYDTQ
jgi:hypothetical protein